MILAAPLGALSGCGFHPVYGAFGGTEQRELGTIDVPVISERSGQLLRQALQQRLADRAGSGVKRYSLSVSYGIAGEGIGIQRDTTSTRLRFSASATWTLKRLDSAQTQVTNGVARALDGVNVLDQQYFAADLESEAAQRRLAEIVANQITLQLATYFSTRGAST